MQYLLSQQIQEILIYGQKYDSYSGDCIFTFFDLSAFTLALAVGCDNLFVLGQWNLDLKS